MFKYFYVYKHDSVSVKNDLQYNEQELKVLKLSSSI